MDWSRALTFIFKGIEEIVPEGIKGSALEQELLKEPSAYAVSKQICLGTGNDLATDSPYSMNKITL